MKLPLVYAQIKIDTDKSYRDRPFSKDLQDFSMNMRDLGQVGSRTTNGGWTCKDSISKSSFALGTVGGKNSSRGE